MKKKILIGALTLSVAAIAITSASLAYFTANDEASNVFTVGNVKIELNEPKWESTGKEEAKEMYPGEAVAKDPTVTNTGANPSLVRVKVEWPTDVKMNYEAGNNYQGNSVNADWYYDAETNYFYYLKALDGTKDATANSTTTPIFDRVRLDRATANGDATTAKEIKVTAEAVQAQGVFSKWSDIADGIDVETELAQVKAFFNTAFNTNPVE